jgi:hypothetical protein
VRSYTYPDEKSLWGVYGYKLADETSKVKTLPHLLPTWWWFLMDFGGL